MSATQPIELVSNNTSDPDRQVATVTDEQGRPWIFAFYGDCGENIAVTPDGRRIHTYTHNGSAPTGVPEVLWFTTLDLIDPD
jgi:hypothetical protein